jgi:hypothetical protein
VKRALRLLGALALLGAIGLFVDRELHIPTPPPTAAELDALRAQRDRLTEQIRDNVIKAGEESLARAPRGGIMIGVPVGFARSIVEQAVTGLFAETTLTLRNLKVQKEGDVKVKMIFRKKTVGNFALNVLIREARGLLKPGAPTVGFANNRIDIALPVNLAEGSGNVSLGFKWDSKGVAANMVCGDYETTREVTGRVVPQTYQVAGTFRIASEGSAITLRPDFGEWEVRIFADPTDQAWGVVDAVMAEQRAGCRDVLEKIDIKAILSRLLGKGFNIKIPKKIFKPISLPAGVRQSLDLQGVKLDISAKATGLAVSGDRLWYGADLQARRVDANAAAVVGGNKEAATMAERR